MRVQITLTGDLAEQFVEEKREIEAELGHEVSRPVALSLMINTPDSVASTSI